MANKKISELTENTNPSGNNILPIVASGTTDYISLSGLSNYVNFNNVVRNVTYSELLSASTASTLSVGGFYRITDFKTIHTIPTVPNNSSVNTKHTGSTEPLIVFAISGSTLDRKAYSETYPNDYIEYDLVDTTSARPNDGTSKGRIAYRKNSVQNISTHYDFRNVVYYKPSYSYELSGLTYPMNPISVDINGSTSIFSTSPSLANISELVTFLRDLGLLIVVSSSGSILKIWSRNGNEYGNLALQPNLSLTEFYIPTENEYMFYTFGNSITTTTQTPAINGNQISSSNSINIGKVSDDQSGVVLNNIVFGTGCNVINIGSEVLIGVISNSVYNVDIKGVNQNFLFDDGAGMIDVGHRSTYGLKIGANSYDISIGNNNSIVTTIPTNVSGWRIGNGLVTVISYWYAQPTLDFSDVLNKNGRIIELGYSNMDISKSITSLTTIEMTINEQFVGIVNLTSSSATETISVIDYLQSNHPVKFYAAAGLIVTFTNGTLKNLNGSNVIINGTNGDWVEYVMLNDIVYQTGSGVY